MSEFKRLLWESITEGDFLKCSLYVGQVSNLNEIFHPGHSYLHQAIECNQPEIAELLIDNGADIELRTQGRLYTPLHQATECGYPECIRMLVRRGADLHGRCALNWTPLHRAVSIGINSHHTLIDVGADINAVDEQGCTPLMVAVLTGGDIIVDDLIHLGANSDLRDVEGVSALDLALARDDHSIIHLLEKAKAKKKESPERER